MRRVFLAILLGLALGVAAGLALGWYLPLTPAKTDPSSLSAEWQSDWILMTAEAYHLDGDLQAARERLGMLGEGDPGARVVDRARQGISSGLPPAYIGALARLAAALNARSPDLDPYLAQ